MRLPETLQLSEPYHEQKRKACVAWAAPCLKAPVGESEKGSPLCLVNARARFPSMEGAFRNTSEVLIPGPRVIHLGQLSGFISRKWATVRWGLQLSKQTSLRPFSKAGHDFKRELNTGPASLVNDLAFCQWKPQRSEAAASTSSVTVISTGDRGALIPRGYFQLSGLCWGWGIGSFCDTETCFPAPLLPFLSSHWKTVLVPTPLPVPAPFWVFGCQKWSMQLPRGLHMATASLNPDCHCWEKSSNSEKCFPFSVPCPINGKFAAHPCWHSWGCAFAGVNRNTIAVFLFPAFGHSENVIWAFHSAICWHSP